MPFRCPICNLSGREVRHHDHIDGWAKRVTQEAIRTPNVQAALEHAKRGLFSQLQALVASPAITRFEPTSICESCNAGEGNLKARRRAGQIVFDPHFSFSPAEMRKIFVFGSRRQIQWDTAQEVFAAQWPSYCCRREHAAQQIWELLSPFVEIIRPSVIFL